tara:strand:+ start:327 stop:965 length:639 start_codon:yes stop_codon:yes gene_type:complete
MFIIKEDWMYEICLLDYDTGIAGKYWHNLPRNKRRQNRWSFEKDIDAWFLSADKTEALYETSSTFLCDKMEDLLGKEFVDAKAAHNYVFASFQQWWVFNKERKLLFKNRRVAVGERTIGDSDIITQGVEMNIEWKDLIEKVEEFAQGGSADDAFFFEYLLLPDTEKHQYWDEKKENVRIGNSNTQGRWVKRQTFYNHLNRFKKKIASAFNAE